MDTGMDGWGPASWPAPAIFLPLNPSSCSPIINFTALGEPMHGRGAQALTPDLLSSGVWQVWLAKRRGILPLWEHRVLPTLLLSFKILPPDVFQASHFSGVTRQRALFLPPL